MRKLFSMMAIVFAVMCAIGAVSAYAQGDPVPPATDWAMKLKDLALLVLVPALWGAVGPTLTVAITAFVNQVIGAYVPRAIQIPLAGMISAVLAGLTGDGSHTAAAGFAEGAMLQSALSMNAKKFLSSAPETKKA